MVVACGGDREDSHVYRLSRGSTECRRDGRAAAASSRAAGPRYAPSTRSKGDGERHAASAAPASARIPADRLTSAANAATRAAASFVPSRRLALIARRRSGSLVNRLSSSTRANAGNAASMPPSSLIGPGGLGHDLLVGVREKARDVGMAHAPQRHDGGDSHGARAMAGQRDDRRGIANACEREASGMPQVRVPVVVVGQHADEVGDGGSVGEPPERFGSEESRARRAVFEQRPQRIGGPDITHVSDQPGGLRPDLGIGVVEELREERRSAAGPSGPAARCPRGRGSVASW